MKNLWNLCLTLYRKYKEQFLYLVVGGLTTLVNFAVYYILDSVCGLHYLFINWIAWAAAVLFAFFFFFSLVFEAEKKGNILTQFAGFVSSRVATLLIEEALLAFTVEILHGSEKIMKLVVAVVTVVLNYVFSKFFVFRKK
ncbi:MAG: GtrA family protein [Clostridia bacterium]|nr:GtrA family protein [Clostridia bacterium]